MSVDYDYTLLEVTHCCELVVAPQTYSGGPSESPQWITTIKPETKALRMDEYRSEKEDDANWVREAVVMTRKMITPANCGGVKSVSCDFNYGYCLQMIMPLGHKFFIL